MASGGWLGNIISLPFRMLGIGDTQEQVRASQSVYPTVTGRDLVTSTESQTPQSAVMGNDADDLYGTKKRRGLNGLYVKKKDSNSTSSGVGTGRSGL